MIYYISLKCDIIGVGGVIMEIKNNKIIYKAYKEFYRKEPNFCKENIRNITIEIQSMLFILREYGINLGCESFVKNAYSDLDLPMDMTIQDIIIGKLIGKNIDLIDDSIKFNELANKYIDVIGSAITNVINNSEDSIETLRVITYILYTRKYVLPTATADVIKKFTNCQETDLENVNRLIYSIKIELCKDNFDKVNIEKMINESENGETSHISEESRKIAVKALLK